MDASVCECVCVLLVVFAPPTRGNTVLSLGVFQKTIFQADQNVLAMRERQVHEFTVEHTPGNLPLNIRVNIVFKVGMPTRAQPDC